MKIQEYYDKCLNDFNKTLKGCKQEYVRYLKGCKEELSVAPLDLSALEECYETLKNPPVAMNGTEDFLFVEGTDAEKFKKQYKALKFARAARNNLQLEEELKKDFNKRIEACQGVEKKTSAYLDDFINNAAKGAKYSLENIRNAKVGLSKGEEFLKKGLYSFGGVGTCMGFLFAYLCSFLEVPELVLPMTLFGVAGVVALFFGFTMKSRKIAARDKGYEITSKEFENRIAAARAEIKKNSATEINEIKETAKAAEEELREQYKKVIGLVERNKKLSDGKLAFLPKISDEELNMTLAAMEDGEAKTYQEALRIAKDRIEQKRETTRKIANDIAAQQRAEKYHKEMLATQKAANDAQLQELERQTEAAKDAAWAAKQSAEANKQQAAAAASEAKSAKNAEKYGKQSAAAMRDIDDRLYRGDAKVEIKKK